MQNGGIILYPTDTIWGLGCDPGNVEAVKKIVTLKKRSNSKSFIVLVHSNPLLNRYVRHIPDICYDLMDMTERPLTIVYPEGQYVANDVLGPDGSIAVRMTKDPFCSGLMNKTRFGLLSTSANLSGTEHPRNLEDVPDEIRQNVDYIVNLQLTNPAAKPSQIIKIGLNNEIQIIRH